MQFTQMASPSELSHVRQLHTINTMSMISCIMIVVLWSVFSGINPLYTRCTTMFAGNTDVDEDI